MANNAKSRRPKGSPVSRRRTKSSGEKKVKPTGKAAVKSSARKPAPSSSDGVSSRRASSTRTSRRRTGPGWPGGFPSAAFRGLQQLFRVSLYWGTVVGVWGGVVLAGVLAYYAYDLPDVDAAFSATRKPSVTVLASDGTELATVGDMYGLPVRLQDLPPALPQAIIATEDRRFYTHFGLDVIGLARAMWVNVRAGRVRQGGSTLTQQVAKNLFLTPERTIKRKVQELLIALWLEHRFSKDEILTVYMNRVYLGAGSWGVDAASRKYFGRPASQVSTWQAAMIGGLMKAPSRLNPVSSPARAEKRTKIVLNNMVAAGYLTEREAEAAHADRGLSLAGRQGAGSRYFVDWVMEQVPDYITLDRDVVVRTTLDPIIQRSADVSVGRALDQAGREQGISQAAVISLSPGGAIRAMVGGRSYGRSQFNRATSAQRQPGSAFKPFVYLAGLEAGLRPDTRMIDEPVDINGWKPRNFDGSYHGTMSLSDAMARSSNAIAVKVARYAGWGNVARVAGRLGITGDPQPHPSLALGTHEVSLLEITAAYATFPNNGLAVWPYAIEDIRDRDGNLLYERSGSGPGQVVARRHVRAVNTMLSRVISAGTGHKATLNRPAAGKTGTSQNFRDGWFIGYTPDLVTGVWMGNDNGAPPRKLTGGGLPAVVWSQVMMTAHEGVAVAQLDTEKPAGPKQGESLWTGLLSGLFGDGG